MPWKVKGLGKSKFAPVAGGEYDTLRIWCYEITATDPSRIDKGTWGLDFPVGTDIAAPGDYEGMPEYSVGRDSAGHPIVNVEVPADTDKVKICFVAGAEEGKAVEISMDYRAPTATNPNDWTEIQPRKKLRGPAVLADVGPRKPLDWLAEYEGVKLAALLSHHDPRPLRPLAVEDIPLNLG